MYARAKLQFRLFSCVISALFHRVQLQPVRNYEFLRIAEQGSSENPLDNKGLVKLHIVIFGRVGLDCISALCPKADIKADILEHRVDTDVSTTQGWLGMQLAAGGRPVGRGSV